MGHTVGEEGVIKDSRLFETLRGVSARLRVWSWSPWCSRVHASCLCERDFALLRGDDIQAEQVGLIGDHKQQ